MKRIISIVLNPFTNDSRVLKECLLLKKLGHQVTVLALHEEGLAEREEIQGIQVHRFRLTSRSWPKRKWVQLIKLFEFYGRSIAGYLKSDIIHCNDLGPLPLAVIMKWLSLGRIKVVYDAHEFETETVNLRPGIGKKFLAALEGFFIKWTDAVITVSDSIAVEYARRYNIPKPALVLNCPNYRVVPKENRFRQRFGIGEDEMIFLYQGALTRGRGLEVLLEAFSSLNQQPLAGQKRAVLVVMGYGPLEKKVREAAEGNANIYYHEAVPPSELLGYTVSADVGISTIENLCLSYYYCLPNKLFEYAMAGLPILVSNMPEMRKVVEQYQAGQVALGQDPAEVAQAVKRMLAADLNQYRENALQMAKEYSWEQQEAALIEVYQGLK